MDYFESVRTRLKFFTMGLVVVGPVLIGLFWNETLQALASNKWPSVQGTILNRVAKTYQSKRHEVKYYGRALYEYEVNGQKYTSDLTDFGPGRKRSDMKQALADVAEYEPGSPTTVYYDPSNPAIAVLQPGVHQVRGAVLVAAAVGTLIGAIACIVNLRRWIASRGDANKDWPSQFGQPA